MARLDLHGPAAAGSEGPATHLRRDLFVGLGELGAAVAEEIPRGWDRRQAPPLTACMTVSRSDLPEDLADPEVHRHRRGLRQAFARPEVLRPLRERARQAVRVCAATPVAGQAPEHLEKRINVYLIVDIGESFGSAVLFDVAALLASLLSGEHMITAVLAFGRDDADRPRLFATLREVEAHRARRGGLGPQLRLAATGGDSPPGLDACVFVSDVNEAGSLPDRGQYVQLVARLLTDFPVNDLIQRGASLLGEGDRGFPYAAAGLASAYFPFQKLRRACLVRWVEGISNALGAPPPAAEPQPPARPDIPVLCPKEAYASVSDRLGELPQPALEPGIAGREPGARTGAQPWEARITSGDSFDLGRSALAKMLLSRWDSFVAGTPETWAEDQLAGDLELDLLDPLRAALAEGVDPLIHQPYGLAIALDALEAARAACQEHLAAANRQVALEHKAYEERKRSIPAMLRRAGAQEEAPPSSIRLPSWRRPLRRWAAAARIRRLRHQVSAWYHRTAAEMRVSCQQMRVTATWRAARAVLQQMLAAVAAKQRAVEALRQALAAAPQQCDVLWQKQARRPTVSDRNILSGASEEQFLKHMAEIHAHRPDTAVLRELLGEHQLLRDFERTRPSGLAEHLAQLAEQYLRDLDNLSLREGLEAAGAAEPFARLGAWVTHEVWRLAAPRLEIEPSGARPVEDRIVDLAMLRAPDMPELQRIGDDGWPHSAIPPTFGRPAAGSGSCRQAAFGVLLCRITHGFDLADVPWLKVCRAEYRAHEHPEELHTVDAPDELPDPTANT